MDKTHAKGKKPILVLTITSSNKDPRCKSTCQSHLAIHRRLVGSLLIMALMDRCHASLPLAKIICGGRGLYVLRRQEVLVAYMYLYPSQVRPPDPQPTRYFLESAASKRLDQRKFRKPRPRLVTQSYDMENSLIYFAIALCNGMSSHTKG